MALATIADLIARIGPLTSEQSARAPGLLEDASALVSGFTRQTFVEASDDVQVIRSQGRTITLPQRPVTDVSQVVAVGVPDSTADITLPAGSWAWDGIDRIEILLRHDWIINLSAVWADWAGTNSYRVTYSHGYSPPPSAVIAVVCNMVNRVLTAPTLSDGLTQETIGQYGWQGQQQVGSMGAGVRLNASDRQTLKELGFVRAARTIETPVR